MLPQEKMQGFEELWTGAACALGCSKAPRGLTGPVLWGSNLTVHSIERGVVVVRHTRLFFHPRSAAEGTLDGSPPAPSPPHWCQLKTQKGSSFLTETASHVHDYNSAPCLQDRKIPVRMLCSQ